MTTKKFTQNVLSESPLNAEPPAATLSQNYITPASHLFHRNHGAPPPSSPHYSLRVTSLEGKSTELDLDKLRREFPEREVTAVLQCAGLRRAEMGEQKEVEGLPWGKGAVGNVKWKGVLLRDVLAKYALSDSSGSDSSEHLHCHFESRQETDDDSFYGASIPLSTALDHSVPVLLAYSMNDEELTKEHGAPLRVVVPGTIGARSVKWLHRVAIRSEESDCFYQKKDYKVLPPSATSETKESFMKNLPALQEFESNCVITSARIAPDSSPQTLVVEGYAFGSRGVPLAKVEVSLNAGETWAPADLTPDDGDPRTSEKAEGSEKKWGWTLWSFSKATTDLLQSTREGKLKVVARCIDVNGVVQTEKSSWNLRGVSECGWSWAEVDL